MSQNLIDELFAVFQQFRAKLADPSIGYYEEAQYEEKTGVFSKETKKFLRLRQDIADAKYKVDSIATQLTKAYAEMKK
jgi:hypothetical protein